MKKNIMNQVQSLLQKVLKNKVSPITTLLVMGAIVYIPLWFWSISLSLNQDYQDFRLPVLGSDSTEYARLSEAIAEKGCFSMRECTAPETFRTPGYPVFILITSIFNNYLFLTTFVQSILALVAGYLLYKIMISFVSERLSQYGMILFVIEPSVLLHSLVLLSDILFVFLIVLATYLLINKHNLFNVSLIIGFSALVRPISIFIVPIFVVFYLWENMTEFKWGYAMKKIILSGLGVSIAVMPWVIRNYISTGEAAITSISSYNLFFYNVPMFRSYSTGKDLTYLQDEAVKNTGIPLEELDSLKHSDTLGTIAKQAIFSQPVEYIVFHLIKTSHFFVGSSIKTAAVSYNPIFKNDLDFNFDSTNLFEYLKRGEIVNFAKSASANIPILIERFLWIVALILSGVALFTKQGRSRKILFFILILYFAIITGPVSYPRYRIPAFPYLLVLSFIALQQIFYAFFERYKRFPFKFF